MSPGRLLSPHALHNILFGSGIAKQTDSIYLLPLPLLYFRYSAQLIRYTLSLLSPRHYWHTRKAVLERLKDELPALTMERMMAFENSGVREGSEHLGVHIQQLLIALGPRR